MKCILRAGSAIASLVGCAGLSGCLVLSYSSDNGLWIWPGSVIVTLGLVALWWFSRRH